MRIFLFFFVLIATPLFLRAQTAYVTNQDDDTVSVIVGGVNLNTIMVMGGSFPENIAFSPDGLKAYVVSNTSNTASVIDVEMEMEVDTFSIPGSQALNAVAFGPAGTPAEGLAYIAAADFQAGDFIAVIDTATNSQTGSITGVGSGAFDVAFSPDGTRAYVPSRSAEHVSVIDVELGMVIDMIPVTNLPEIVAVGPDGTPAEGLVYAGAITGGEIAIIDVAMGMQTGTIMIGTTVNDIVFHPDGAIAYVSKGVEDEVDVITVSMGSVTSSIMVGSFPDGIAFSPNGSLAYVVNTGDNNVSVVNVSMGMETGTIMVGTTPISVAFLPEEESGAVIAQGYQQLDCPGGTTVTNNLSWTPTIDPSTIGAFKIYRGSPSSLIDEVSGSTRQYEDSGRPSGMETYNITAVVGGVESDPVEVTVDAL